MPQPPPLFPTARQRIRQSENINGVAGKPPMVLTKRQSFDFRPLLVPSPRASDPAPLEVSRANIAFAKCYKLPSESLQKRNAVRPGPPVFLYFLTLAGRFVGSGENDEFFLCSSLPAAGHRRERLRKNPMPLTISLTIPRVFNINGPGCPERFHPPRSRMTDDENNFA